MATDSFSQTLAPAQSREASRVQISDVVQAIVAPLASLKLTVVLLLLAIALTFIATLDQTRADVFDVKMKHFRSVFVAVPFQTFFVPAWAPEHQNVQGRVYLPSGLTILVLLLINLTAAHSMRFRLQARGKKLLVGTLVALFAGLVTWAVIFNNQNADGFQAQPPISYWAMWRLLQVGVAVVAVACGLAGFLRGAGKRIERTMLWTGSAVCASFLAITVYLGESAFIGDSAMRILWQLMQATVAAVVAYVACALLFHRKAGMVLLHLGVAGLMVNEIFVTVTNNEQRMTIFEGETVGHAIDIRETEMAIINMADEELDEIISIPGSRLRSGERISDPALPFDVQTVEYLPASELRTITDPSANLATDGVGMIGEAYQVPPVAGTDSEQIADVASAYVELFDKTSGESLGVHLISQALADSRADTVRVGDTDYRIQLRFKTEYKPYALTLSNATRENYLGTEIPRYYGSDVVINDFDSGLETEQTIYMNEPLRYSNETFYQSGMDRDSAGREFSTLQIVTNVGWMIPYVCCMFTVVGLVAQFGTSLLGFLRKRAQAPTTTRREAAIVKPDNLPHGAKVSRSWIGWIPAGVAVAAAGFWAVYCLMGADWAVEKDGMRLDLLARLPVTFEGRVQPLGSFADNTARQLSMRESIADGRNKSQPAIRWFADVVFGAEDSGEYRTFRIVDPNVINALKLPKQFSTDLKRKKFLYTIDELMESRAKLAELIPDPRQKNKKSWSQLESRLGLLGQKLQQLMGLQLTLGTPEADQQDWLVRLEAANMLQRSTLTPLVVPQDSEEQPWISLTTANARQWLARTAAEFEVETTGDLSRKLVEREILPKLRDEMVRDRVIERLMQSPEFSQLLPQGENKPDPAVLAQMLRDRWNELPPQLLNALKSAEGPLVEAMLQQQLPEIANRLEARILPLTGGETKLDVELADEGNVKLLNQLRPAYLAGDAETFNETLETYLANVAQAPPTGFSLWKHNLERHYNSFMPFYLAMVIYVAVALIASISWLVFPVSLGRTAMSLLLLAMLIHFTGLVMRVAISGRPPVTNLYSSVLFVSLAGIGLLCLFEMMTRLRIGTAMAGQAGFLALIWANSMTIIDGDTFTVMVAVLDTSFWLATHVVCISLGYAAAFVAGLLGIAYLVAGLLTPALKEASSRRLFSNLIYGLICFALFFSFFGTVLGGLWGDDSWGRFWGWDPKENGALMIVLTNAVILHARWGGMIRDRGLAACAALGNLVVLWSWKGVNALGVGLHAYAGTEDDTMFWITMVGGAHVLFALIAILPTSWWMSYQHDVSRPQTA